MSADAAPAAPATDEHPDRGGVVLAIVDGGTWSSAYGLSLTDMLLFDAFGERSLLRPGCGFMHQRAATNGLPEARNACMRQFLDHTAADWMLMVDTDMSFSPDLLVRLLDAADPVERPVVGALTFALKPASTGELRVQRYRIQPVLYHWADIPEGDGRPAEAGFMPLFDYPRDQLVPVAGTGAACLLVHRSAGDKVRELVGDQWFTMLTHPTAAPGGGPRVFSEDLSFCARLDTAGVPMFVHTGVRTAHDKGGVFLDEQAYDDQRRHAEQDARPPSASTSLLLDDYCRCTLAQEPGTHADDCPQAGRQSCRCAAGYIQQHAKECPDKALVYRAEPEDCHTCPCDATRWDGRHETDCANRGLTYWRDGAWRPVDPEAGEILRDRQASHA